jgi:hypothetical protein
MSVEVAPASGAEATTGSVAASEVAVSWQVEVFIKLSSADEYAVSSGAARGTWQVGQSSIELS